MADINNEQVDPAAPDSPRCRHPKCTCMGAENGYCSIECQAADMNESEAKVCDCGHGGCETDSAAPPHHR